MILIFDIDGTLTTSGDTPNEPVIARLREEAEKGERIFIVSGRLAARMDETKAWLSENEIPYEAIYLQDFSEDSSLAVIEAFKAFKYSKLLEEFGDQIGYLVDDDAEARDAAEGMGINAYGPEAFVRLSDRSVWGDDPKDSTQSRIIGEASEEDAQRNEGDEMAIEFRRTTAELRAVDEDGFTFEGMAAVYDSPSADGTSPEVVKKGAFSRSLAAAGRGEWDVKAYADHNPERLLGTTKTGTLELEDREDGLLARIRLNPNVSFHRDLAEIVRTMGKSLGLSFGFYSTNANKVNEEGVRELRDVKLVEVSALTGLSPYYPSTISTVSVRSLASEAGLEIEPLRAAVNALLSGDVSEDQARLLAEAIAAVVAEDEAEKAEDIVEGEVVAEETPEEQIVEESAPRSVPRSTREKEIELAKRALR